MNLNCAKSKLLMSLLWKKFQFPTTKHLRLSNNRSEMTNNYQKYKILFNKIQFEVGQVLFYFFMFVTNGYEVISITE